MKSRPGGSVTAESLEQQKRESSIMSNFRHLTNPTSVRLFFCTALKHIFVSTHGTFRKNKISLISTFEILSHLSIFICIVLWLHFRLDHYNCYSTPILKATTVTRLHHMNLFQHVNCTVWGLLWDTSTEILFINNNQSTEVLLVISRLTPRWDCSLLTVFWPWHCSSWAAGWPDYLQRCRSSASPS